MELKKKGIILSVNCRGEVKLDEEWEKAVGPSTSDSSFRDIVGGEGGFQGPLLGLRMQ